MNRCPPSDFFQVGTAKKRHAFCVLVSGFCSDWSRLVMSVKLRLSTPGAGNSRHGSARVVACDEALPAPGGALKIAARIGRSADVVIELLSVSNRVDPNTLLIGDRYSKHSHNACFHSSAFQGLGMTSNGPAGRRPMHEAAMLAATAFPLGIAAAWRTRPHRRPPSREPQKCVTYPGSQRCRRRVCDAIENAKRGPAPLFAQDPSASPACA